MAQRQHLLLVHSSFVSSTADLQDGSSEYSAAFLKQLEKMQADPHRAGDRYDCDGLPAEYADYIRKCDIKGPRGPKVFYYIWNENGLVLPFFVTSSARKDIDYRSLHIETHAEEIIRIVEGWPSSAGDCEMWMVDTSGSLQRVNAGEFIAKRPVSER
jgi:hypothetical protein